MGSLHALAPETLADDLVLPRESGRSLLLALMRAREKVAACIAPYLIQHDLTEQQWRVLRVVAGGDCHDAREVAEKACLLAPSLTRIIRVLEERGLLHRELHADDRRRILLTITPEAEAIVKQVIRETADCYRRFTEEYGQDRMEQLLDLLADLVAVGTD